MRKSFRYGLIAFLGACLCPIGVGDARSAPTITQDNVRSADRAEILRLERATWQTYKDKDARSYRRLVAVDYVNVGGDGIFGLDKELRDMVTSAVESFTISDIQVHFPAPATAVVTYIVLVTRAGDPRRKATPFYDASVWVHGEGGWKNVLHNHARKEQ